MIGTSRVVREGIAVGYEFVRLHVQAGQLTYSAHPSGQPPADFVATYVGPGVVRFENPTHDFPQKIEYRAAHPDSLLASVFAATGDDEPSFELRYARESCSVDARPAQPFQLWSDLKDRTHQRSTEID